MLLDDEPVNTRNFRQMMQNEFDRLVTRNMPPSNQLLNPFAWGKFIEAIENKEVRLDVE
ncbi:MAG: hypothetical protein HC896_17890 [Bacteroidales bacterium]|nr:hypothetical protein [Bacteroidales bacterium]